MWRCERLHVFSTHKILFQQKSMRIYPRCFSASSVVYNITKPAVLLVKHDHPSLCSAGSEIKTKIEETNFERNSFEVYTQTSATRLNQSDKTTSVSIIAPEQDPFYRVFSFVKLQTNIIHPFHCS